MIRKAVRILRRGGIVAFPTETVYGLGARVFDEKAVRRIFAAKGRPRDNPLIVHISDLSQLDAVAERIPAGARPLIKDFWPGPLTLVFKKKPAVPRSVTAGLDTVAVRMPAHPSARKLIRALGEPVAAPSANSAGRPSGTSFEAVRDDLKGKADLIVPGGRSRYGLESTVVDCTRFPFRLLRPGFVTLEDLRRRADVRASAKLSGAPLSPGLKHRHYKPDCPILIVSPKKWHKTLKRNLAAGKKIAVLSLNKPAQKRAGILFWRNFRGNEVLFARELYGSFLKAEKKKADLLVVESTKTAGLGRAIMDRLVRASGRV